MMLKSQVSLVLFSIRIGEKQKQERVREEKDRWLAGSLGLMDMLKQWTVVYPGFLTGVLVTPMESLEMKSYPGQAQLTRL